MYGRVQVLVGGVCIQVRLNVKGLAVCRLVAPMTRVGLVCRLVRVVSVRCI